MLTAVISDQHFGVRGTSPIFLDNYERFYKDVFMKTIEEQKIEAVVGLGDLWEVRPGAGWRAIDAAKQQFFEPLAKMGIPVTMIYGNHDVALRNTNRINGVDFLSEMYPNVTVIKDRGIIDIGVKFGLISWINRENYQESMEWLDTVDVDRIGGHFEINDFEMTRGQVATHGFDRAVFKRFKHVYSGHFHVRGTIDNITYLSNPSQTNWGDIGLKKGFHIFDSKTGDMTPVDNPYVMFKEGVWGDENLTPEYFEGVYGRVVVPKFADVKRAELDLFMNRARELSHSMYVIEDAVVADGITVRADEVTSTAAIIDAYIQDAYGSKEGIDLGRLKGDFNDLYTEASSKLEIE